MNQNEWIKRFFRPLLALSLCLTLLSIPAGAASVQTHAVGEEFHLGVNANHSADFKWTYPKNLLRFVRGTSDDSDWTFAGVRPGRGTVSCSFAIYGYMPGYIEPQPIDFDTFSWEVEITGDPCAVTFDFMDGSAPSVQSAFTGGTVSPPGDAARPGFLLDGWFTDKAFTLRYDFSTPLTGDLTLYARWLTARTVSFRSMGERVAVRTVADGGTVSPPSLDIPRGYAFAGWHTDAACTRAYSFSAPVVSDFTLYAKWRPLDEATVSFDCLDGSEPVRVTGYVGETLNPPAPPGRDGWEFAGWYENAQCTESFRYLFDEPLEKSLTLYAGWREAPKPVRITFDSQGGPAVKAQSILTGERAERPEDPEREGYTFDGWFDSPACWNLWDFQNAVTSAMTLYAGWTRNEYTVEFIYQPPEGGDARTWLTQTAAHGETIDEPSPPRSLYLFGGWRFGVSTYDFNRPVTEDLQLVTEWLPFSWEDNRGAVDDGLTWELDTEGVLSFSGQGGTGGYSFYDGRSRPAWHSLREYIRTIDVGRGADSVGENSFRDCAYALSASLPDGLESIGAGAFQYCLAMTEVNIPSSARSIGSSAFEECGSLQTVEIPEGVTELLDSVFSDCISLRSVSLPDGLELIGDYAFLNCGSLGELRLALPDTLTSLGSHVFSGSGLRSVRIPGGVREVGAYAFQNCKRLEIAALADGVESVGEFAFDGCPRLRTVIIPASVRRIGDWAFDIRSVREGPVHIFYAGSREQWNAIDIPSLNNDLEYAVIHYNCPEAGTLVPVSFDAQGGSPVEEQLRLPGETLETPQAPERTGYAFTGWYRDFACTKPWDFTRDTIDGETTLYAGWAPVPRTVQFSGGDSQTVGHGQRAAEPAVPVREGATFNGWYTDQETRTLYLFRSPVTEDLLLYPGWLDARENPAEPDVPSDNPYAAARWTDNAVILQGPAERLGDIRQVWAAAYTPEGRLTDVSAGRLDGVTLTFSKVLAPGWRLFLLDENGAPLCNALVI